MCRSRLWSPTIPDLLPPTGGRFGRRLLGAASLGLLSRPARSVAATLIPAEAELLIAGPGGGRLDRVGTSLVPGLLRALPAGGRLRVQLVGGPDGVTGANQFETRGAPDGGSVLLMPGEAGLAWLAGDVRARFNARDLAPVLAGVAPGVLMGRRPLDSLPADAPPRRIAVGRPDGPDLAALLALDLLGLPAAPLFGLQDTASVEQAILSHGADLAFVTGPDALRRIARLAHAGLSPLFTLGVPDADKAIRRDPLLPDVPTLPELVLQWHGAPPAGPLYDAWCAVAVFAQLTFLLALPPLTPAAIVSLWRQAGVHVAAILTQKDAPEDVIGPRLLADPETTQFTAPMATVGATALLELRRWLATRLGRQPA